ncbi:DUF1223 domain-containing protein [Salaquimonas pukyongi]|uniref:DUF1223 domain-containing protein n=1 Tax=Salaquimonas pukyongi TaxID=2712698 RepID=UPI0009FB7B40|nr:DUF1223 domain-containing protein [Salaquimonas pukyongi]
MQGNDRTDGPRPMAGRLAAMTLAAVLTAVSGANALAVEFITPKAVVELFTSQGCSSCPPADAALGEFNAGKEILGLAMHVDYWDRLGWKDTFASPENTERQWRYAGALGERQVYTPQAIVNGRAHFVGSRKGNIVQAAEQFSDTGKGLTVPIDLTTDGNVISVSIAPSPEARDATLYAIYYNSEGEVHIEHGENAGKTITYSNIVRKMEMLGMAGSGGMELQFSIPDIRQKGFTDCALILQTKTADGLPGPIIGASVISGI